MDTECKHWIKDLSRHTQALVNKFLKKQAALVRNEVQIWFLSQCYKKGLVPPTFKLSAYHSGNDESWHHILEQSELKLLGASITSLEQNFIEQENQLHCQLVKCLTQVKVTLREKVRSFFFAKRANLTKLELEAKCKKLSAWSEKGKSYK